jgi:outer membrane protein assembly factor BamB
MRSRWPVLLAVAVVVVGLPGVVVARKAGSLRQLGTPVRLVTSDAPAPAPLPASGGEPINWTVRSDGRVTDVAVLPSLGLVIYVEEVAHRSWRATAVDARTGQVRWSNARAHTAHIEAWTVTETAVVLAYHHSASRLAWRTHRAASFEGVDPLTGEVRWTRHVYTLIGERPGDHAPTLASPKENVVYARSEVGVPNGIDTRTGETRWEYPALNDCKARANQIVAGPGGVAISQRCPKGKQRVALVNPHTGKAIWRFSIATPSLRLLGVGTDSVAMYQGGSVQRVIILGPGGVATAHIPCDCGDGAALSAGFVGGTTLAAGSLGGRIGVGGYLVVGGPFGLVGADGGTGQVLWEKPVPGGPVREVLARDGDVHVVSGEGDLLRVNPADGTTELVTRRAAPPEAGAIVATAGGYVATGTGEGFSFTGPVAAGGV